MQSHRSRPRIGASTAVSSTAVATSHDPLRSRGGLQSGRENSGSVERVVAIADHRATCNRQLLTIKRILDNVELVASLLIVMRGMSRVTG
jgi:hypothetical protein